MFKKFFCAALMAATVIFFGNAKIFAQDVPIESYSSRVRCFVMTETFINRTQYRDNRTFGVDVKFVGATVVVNNYSFRENDGLIFYSVDGGTENFVDNDEFAKRIWKFGLKYLGIDYEVRYD